MIWKKGSNKKNGKPVGCASKNNYDICFSNRLNMTRHTQVNCPLKARMTMTLKKYSSSFSLKYIAENNCKFNRVFC